MRRQLTVYSPLRSGAILAGAVAAVKDSTEERTALEAELRDRFRAERVILTGSGTEALQLALVHPAFVESRGGVVALPGYSCYDLVTAARGAGTKVRFYDLDPRTLTPDLDSLRAVLRDGVSVVVAGNLWGYPLNWTDLRSECAAAGVGLIEDAAQGLGTTSDGGPGGTLGDATVLSFGRGKGWTGGGGGALLLRRDAAESQLDLHVSEAPATRSATRLAVTAAAWVLGRPALYRIPLSVPGFGLGETRYREPRPPSAIPGFSAALARRTASDAIEAIEGRRRTACTLLEILRTRTSVTACKPLGGPDSASFLRLPAVVRRADATDSVLRRGAHLGVAATYPKALHQLPQARPLMPSERQPLPGSEELASALITLPTHRWVSDSDIAELSELFTRTD